jgi:hypothetical protein
MQDKNGMSAYIAHRINYRTLYVIPTVRHTPYSNKNNACMLMYFLNNLLEEKVIILTRLTEAAQTVQGHHWQRQSGMHCLGSMMTWVLLITLDARLKILSDGTKVAQWRVCEMMRNDECVCGCSQHWGWRRHGRAMMTWWLCLWMLSASSASHVTWSKWRSDGQTLIS